MVFGQSEELPTNFGKPHISQSVTISADHDVTVLLVSEDTALT
jgi:hypothetical protein